jgi:hypothetical protein
VPAKTCTVTYSDLDGASHSVEVPADSLYEAAALGLQAFRKAPFIDLNPGPASRLGVVVREPAVGHAVTMLR